MEAQTQLRAHPHDAYAGNPQDSHAAKEVCETEVVVGRQLLEPAQQLRGAWWTHSVHQAHLVVPLRSAPGRGTGLPCPLRRRGACGQCLQAARGLQCRAAAAAAAPPLSGRGQGPHCCGGGAIAGGVAAVAVGGTRGVATAAAAARALPARRPRPCPAPQPRRGCAMAEVLRSSSFSQSNTIAPGSLSAWHPPALQNALSACCSCRRRHRIKSTHAAPVTGLPGRCGGAGQAGMDLTAGPGAARSRTAAPPPPRTATRCGAAKPHPAAQPPAPPKAPMPSVWHRGVQAQVGPCLHS